MKNIKIHDSELLYEKNGFYYVRNKKGVIQKIIKNIFNHGEIVQCSEKHHSPKSFTRVINPAYINVRGWVYTENYIQRNKDSGGCGMWFNEDLFLKLNDPSDIMFAERIYLNQDIKNLQKELEQKVSQLEKIEFALNLSVPNYNNIIDRCNECNVLYDKDNQGNVNKSICKNCSTK